MLTILQHTISIHCILAKHNVVIRMCVVRLVTNLQLNYLVAEQSHKTAMHHPYVNNK